MASKPLPIAGYPHMHLAEQENDKVHERILTELRARGFAVEPELLVPPENASTTDVIRAITDAFQRAKADVGA